MNGSRIRGESAIQSIKYLVADGPFEPMRKKLMLFGQFVGDWDIVEAESLQDDGSWKRSSGELHSGWILGGTAVQDIWRSTEDGNDDAGGTTIHFYDQETDCWNSVWISPAQGTIRGFVGRKVGKEIVLESRETSRKMMRWVFYEIKRNSFRWKAEYSNDSGRSWTTMEKMLIRRQRDEGNVE
jgi:hypothetical protein